MKNQDINLDLKSILPKVRPAVAKVRRYGFLIFLVSVVIIYSFVLLRINSLRGAEPTPDQITQQAKTSNTPNIDEDIVKQLESLEDNSVSVKALFDEARSNPFQ